MQPLSPAQAEEALTQLTQHFAQWRQNRQTPRGRIPHGLWAQAVALTQGYAKGTVFTMANPEAAIRILWEVFPQTKATGKDEATALRDDLKTLQARARNWRLEAGGVTQWGENS